MWMTAWYHTPQRIGNPFAIAGFGRGAAMPHAMSAAKAELILCGDAEGAKNENKLIAHA